MLQKLGLSRLEELFEDLPAELRFPELKLPEPLDEVALLRRLSELAARTQPAPRAFLGGGIRSHHVFAVAPALATRAEFLSAYTPYQPEVSQGLLQAIFEYQTMISELTGLPVANASMYDGASALAEGVLLALRETGRMRVVVSQGVHPEYRQVLATYLAAVGATLEVVPLRDGRTLDHPVDSQVGAWVVQSPNYLGALEDLRPLVEAAHRAGALVVMVADPLSLALLKSPGAWGADIAVGEGQPLGNPMSFGGPHFGFLAVRENLLRQIPGRLVSETRDMDGRRGYILTLQAREQYIRRSKARSNITTNAQLTALMAAIQMAGLGPQGLREIALRAAAGARELARRLGALPGVRRVTPEPFFNEFVLKLPRSPQEVRRALARKGLHAALPVPEEYGTHLALFAVTEVHEEDDVKALEEALKEVL